MDVSSPVTTWIVGDRFAHRDAARHSLLAPIPTGLASLVSAAGSLTRAIVPDRHTVAVWQSRPPTC